MSLKVVHLCFIGLSIILSIGVGLWGVRSCAVSGRAGDGLIGAVAWAGVVLLVAYARSFVRKMKRWGAFVVIGIGLSVPHTALACATCFGAADAPMTHGMNWAILTLLAVTAVVLGGVAVFLISMVRRSQGVG